MPTKENGNETTSTQTNGNGDGSQPKDGIAHRLMAMSGYVLITGTVALLAMLVWLSVQGAEVATPSKGQSIVAWTIQHYGYAMLIVLGAAISAALGVKLLGAVGKGVPTVIPPQDYALLAPLIKSAKKDAISQYVILSSLSGFTGTFQKIGFAGLPLATAILTLTFSILSFFQADFLELAKLTLGAFIGSFVQKGQDAPQLSSFK